MMRRSRGIADQHQDWLSQVDTDGPFLALPVLKDIWPQGVERLGDADDRMVTFKQAYLQWKHAFDTYTGSVKTDAARVKYGSVNQAWIELVLDELAGWNDLRMPADDDRLKAFEITSPGGEIKIRPSGALEGRDGELAALLLVSAPTTDLRAKGLDGWAATEIDRMAMLLRKARVEVGIVTDGQWWAIVWAKDGKPTGSGMVNGLTWAEEPLLRDAFLTLLDKRRYRAKDTEQRLPRLFERSELEAEEITEALGTQVRKSVELLVQAFSEARLTAAERSDPDPLTDQPDDVYQAAVTIMMRVVFLLFAEERDMLPTEQLYWDSYAIRDVLDQLQQRATDGEEHLDETYDAWHRLLAVSHALFAGVNYDEMRMPAYGGSLLDPARFPWLHATDRHGLRLRVSDRVMLHVFDSVQTVVVKNERRRISFRDIDVEQIGYIYEGLLGYTCQTVERDVVLGLVGKDGEEPEITLGGLQELYDDSTSSKMFAADLLAWIKENQPAATPKTANALAKLVEIDLSKAQEAELTRLLTPVAGNDSELLRQLVSWGNLIRRDLRGIPYVVPVGGLVVNETPSRKNAGAHYTPRSLAEEVVKHALKPLVYEPGPLQTNDENAWKLKSSTAILDLKIADIAAGSGAFLVAAARFLADRVTEAWTDEGMLGGEEQDNSKLANGRAIREVIARCLYGADINPMAVEMSKLSLWLVSMDRTKPFSFVDDKLFCGNSLLGITSLDQLRAVHIYLDPKRDADLLDEVVDLDGRLAEAIRLRKELVSPIDEHNPMRSTRGKRALLDQAKRATADLRLVADGIVAAGLPLGGKPGTRLNDAYELLRWQLAEAFPRESTGKRTKLETLIDTGLTPTVRTDFERWRPLHWVLDAPDVFVDRNGFDAIIGNPPFMVSKNISGAIGAEVREWLVEVIGGGRRGPADIVAYFVLRAVSLLSDLGQFGLITAKAIGEGDTRHVALDASLGSGITLRVVAKSRRWPASTVTAYYALVCGSRAPLSAEAQRICGGEFVADISSTLEPASRVGGQPVRLPDSRGRGILGSFLLGDGFLLYESEAAEVVNADARNKDVVFRYLNGDDLNSRLAQTGDRWAIYFRDWDRDRAELYPEPFEIVRDRVQLQRSTQKGVLRDRWWVYKRPTTRLYDAISDLDYVIAVSVVSRHAQPILVPSCRIFSSAVVVFPTSDFGCLALLSSIAHQAWVWKWASTMGVQDLRYTPSDVLETFPFVPDQSLSEIGRELSDVRADLMQANQIGLTALYNEVTSTNPNLDVARLRAMHREVDHRVLSLYGWSDLDGDHGVYRIRGANRYSIAPAKVNELQARLLELNHGLGRDLPGLGSSS